jgi:hypothetical protein
MITLRPIVFGVFDVYRRSSAAILFCYGLRLRNQLSSRLSGRIYNYGLSTG